MTQRTDSVRTSWISAAVSAACFALYLAEAHGFRIFEESVRNIQTAEAVVPSPMEILTVLGITSLGICAGLVAMISLVVWFVHQARHARDASENDCANAGAQISSHQSAS